MDTPVILMMITFSLLILHIALRKVNYNGVTIKRGKHFSINEKIHILKVIDHMENVYKDHREIGMCIILKGRLDSCIYFRLCNLYHNPSYYDKMGLKVNLNDRYGYWWNLNDWESRLDAIKILRNTVIND